MCLITLNWQPGQAVPLRMAANRDEWYARPTLGVHHWPGQGILAGRDLQAGGTWLGLGVGGGAGHIRLAALTNYRDAAHHRLDAMSRGHITASFLNSSVGARDYLESLVATAHCYNPFNLILFDGQALLGFESRHARLFALPVGITSVSNADFNTPWPKLKRLHRSFEQTLAASHEASHDEAWLQNRLLKLLCDDQTAPDSELPRTGLALDKERVLSAAFIRTPDYGTRASSVIRIGSHHAQFTERCFDANGLMGEATHTLSWGNSDRY